MKFFFVHFPHPHSNAWLITLVNPIHHEDVINFSIGCQSQLIPWWDKIESQEHECSDEYGSIHPVLLEANNGMMTSEHFFCVLQQSHECLFRSIRQTSVGYFNVQVVVDQSGVPGERGLLSQWIAESDFYWLIFWEFLMVVIKRETWRASSPSALPG